MKEIKIKNNGNRPIVVGGKMCPGGGQITAVDEAAFGDYCKAVSGSYVMEKYLDVVDKDYEKKMAEKAKAVKAEGSAEAGKLLIVIDGLHVEVKALNAEIDELNNELEKATAPDAKPPKTKGFTLDPEKHHIEHRGAGKWFVMELEEKVYGPLTEEEKASFGDMLK